MRRAWGWWRVWVVVVCLVGAGRGIAECKDEIAKARGELTNPNGEGKDWTWRDRDGCVRTRAELDKMFLQANQAEDAWLSKQPVVQYPSLSNQRPRVELRGADLMRASLVRANLYGAILENASLSFANLTRADLFEANLSGAWLNAANLTGADLRAADLTFADLDGSDLSGAKLYGADLMQAMYEPGAQPWVGDIAYAKGLGFLSYRNNPEPLHSLRKAFQDAGFERQRREITASLHRHNQNPIEFVLFDWTCKWGADWSHPLVLLEWLCLLCGPVYWVGMHFAGKGGIYQIVLDDVVATKAAKEIVSRVDVGVKWVEGKRLRRRSFKVQWRLIAMALRAEWRALRLAFLFSVLSALDIGFHEFNVGVWARMLLARDFNLKARGWMRVAGGVQSLVGLGLVALSLLSYFGHPFD